MYIVTVHRSALPKETTATLGAYSLKILTVETDLVFSVDISLGCQEGLHHLIVSIHTSQVESC